MRSQRQAKHAASFFSQKFPSPCTASAHPSASSLWQRLSGSNLPPSRMKHCLAPPLRAPLQAGQLAAEFCRARSPCRSQALRPLPSRRRLGLAPSTLPGQISASQPGKGSWDPARAAARRLKHFWFSLLAWCKPLGLFSAVRFPTFYRGTYVYNSIPLLKAKACLPFYRLYHRTRVPQPSASPCIPLHGHITSTAATLNTQNCSLLKMPFLLSSNAARWVLRSLRSKPPSRLTSFCPLLL